MEGEQQPKLGRSSFEMLFACRWTVSLQAVANYSSHIAAVPAVGRAPDPDRCAGRAVGDGVHVSADDTVHLISDRAVVLLPRSPQRQLCSRPRAPLLCRLSHRCLTPKLHLGNVHDPAMMLEHGYWEWARLREQLYLLPALGR